MTIQEREEWQAPPLSADDQKLVDAYRRIGRLVDDLPYTDDFDRLCQEAGLENTNEARHNAFRRLLTLRKQGRLPRVYGVASSAL